MATLEELVVSLVAETSGLRAELSNAAKATEEATSKMDAAISEFSKASSEHMGFFETAMASAVGFLTSELAEKALEMAKEAFTEFIAKLEEGVVAAEKQEQAFVRLANSMAITGQYSQEGQKGLQEFTEEMEKLTGVQHTAIAENLALLSSLTKLDADGLKAAQKAALDMSTALGIDLNTATHMVAKGIEGHIQSFQRYGITIQEGATKAEQFANVVKTLEANFGGAAEGSMKTFEGSLKSLHNSFENLGESLGNVIVQNPVIVAMIGQLAEVFSDLKKYIDENSVELREGLAEAIIAVSKTLGFLLQIGDTVFRAMIAYVQLFKMEMNAVTGAVSWLGDKLGLIKDNDPFASLKKTSEDLNKTMTQESALGKMATVLADMGAAGERAFGQIGNAAKATKPTIDEHGKALEELGGKEKQILAAFAQGLADEGMALDSQFQYQKARRQLALDTELADLKNSHKNKFELQAQFLKEEQKSEAANFAREQADLKKAHTHGLISDQQYNAAKLQLNRKHDLDERKMEADMTKFKEAEQAARMQGYDTFLTGVSALTQSSNKELQAIGKAAAITKATIDAYMAIQNALANVPFPANIAASAGIGIMAFANVAKIAGIGFNEGGTVPGGGANMDSVPAMLTTGETVVNRDLTDKLGAFLKRQDGGAGGQGHVTLEIHLKDNLVEFIEAKIVERMRTNISLLSSV